MKNNNPSHELNIQMLPKKLKRITSEDVLYSEYALYSEFIVVLYPETSYSVNISNDTQISFDLFASKICSQFKENYPLFRELRSLKVLRYFKKNKDEYVPIQINDFNEIPSPLYVELSSNEVWVKIHFEIKAGNHSFNGNSELILNRSLNKEDTNWCLVKTIISMWNHTYKEKIDFLNLHYLITRYDITHEIGNEWFEELYNNKFNFNVSLQLKIISIEELIFNSFQLKYKNRKELNSPCQVLLDKFVSIPSFYLFAHEVLFEKEYKLIKTLTQSKIFKLNKANRLYVYYSSWGYKGGNLDHSFCSDIESMTKLNVIVRPKIRRLQIKEKLKAQSKFKSRSFKLSQPIVNVLSANTTGSAKKMYKEKSNDKTDFENKKRKIHINNSEIDAKVNKMEKKIKELKKKSNFEKINLQSNFLFRTFAGDNSDNNINKINGNPSDISDTENNKPMPSIVRDIKKTINKTYIMNLITSASSVKIQKFTFDKYAIPRIRNFRQKITLTSYWNHYKAPLCYAFFALLITLTSCALIIYCVSL